MAAAKKVLVLGATGHVGGPLVEELKKSGTPVRAAVRNPKPIRSSRVESVAFDYFNPATYEQAFKNITDLYLLTPVMENPLELVKNLLKAAQRAGVQKVVRQSAYGADQSEGVRLLKWHLECEKLIQESGIPYVFLRPTGFFQNYLLYADEISQAGVFHLSVGSDRSSYVDARDVASVASAVLREEGHEGRTYPITGPQALSNEDIADILSDVTGDQIKFVPISDQVERRNLLEEGTPTWLAEGLVELHRFWREENAAEVLPTIRDVSGRDPMLFERFARENKEIFKRKVAA